MPSFFCYDLIILTNLGITPQSGDNNLQTHRSQFGADNLATKSLEDKLQKSGQNGVNFVMTLKNNYLEKLGSMGFGFVIVHVGIEDLFDHFKDDFKAKWLG